MSGAARKQVLSRAQMRLADRSDACEGPGWSRTEHMQQESGYVGGVPKMAAGAEAFLEDAGCWQASLPNARELLEAAGARERARVGGSGRRVDCPRAWLAPGSPEEGTTPRPAKEGALPLAWRAGLILTREWREPVTKQHRPGKYVIELLQGKKSFLCSKI